MSIAVPHLSCDNQVLVLVIDVRGERRLAYEALLLQHGTDLHDHLTARAYFALLKKGRLYLYQLADLAFGMDEDEVVEVFREVGEHLATLRYSRELSPSTN